MGVSESRDSNGAQLSGWKEIAAYVGKGVRQAQRWERLGMPVHRVQGMDGVVYAYRAEIDAWRQLPSGATLESETGGSAAGAAPPEPPVITDRESPSDAREPGILIIPKAIPSRRDRAVAMVGLGLLAIVLTFATASLLPPRGDVSNVSVAGRMLHGLNSAGAVLWSFELGFTGRLLDQDTMVRRPSPLLADLDSDGVNEVIVAVRNGHSYDELFTSDVLFCFSQDGTLRWSFSLPAISYTFDGQEFPGPTRLLTWMTDGEGAVWAAANHHTWWPTVVLGITSAGEAKEYYVQSGAVFALNTWRVGEKKFLVAAGVDNEYGLATIAVVDTASGPATSPQTPGTGFNCDQCPRQSPALFALIPRSEISRVADVQPYSYGVRVDRAGSAMRVSTFEGEKVVLYHLLKEDFTIVPEPAPDSYGQVHARLESENRLDHRFEQCPDRQASRTPFLWRPHGEWSATPPARRLQRSLQTH